MKLRTIISITILFAMSFIFLMPVAWGGSPEKDVYVLNVQGDVYWESKNKKETETRKLRIMELIRPGTFLDIKKGASVTLTCPNCKIVRKKNSYKVDMADFEKKSLSIAGAAISHFWKALKFAAYPSCNPGQGSKMVVRGESSVNKGRKCECLWPPDGSDILPMGKSITFEWGLNGRHFLLEIKEEGANNIVYSETTKSNSIKVPFEKLKQGTEFMVYEWTLTEEKRGNKWKATFGLLSKKESKEILDNLNDILSLLPSEANDEIRCRLQAGYFRSEGLIYNARHHFIESKMMHQHYDNNERDNK